MTNTTTTNHDRRRELMTQNMPEEGTVEEFMRSIIEFAQSLHLELDNGGVDDIDSGLVLGRVVQQQRVLAESVLAIVGVLDGLAGELRQRFGPPRGA
jgi:hypothetical protein